MQPVRIGLLSPQSNRNLGDTAIFTAAVAAFRRRLPEAELVVVVPDPAESAHLFGTSGFPLYGEGVFIPEGSVVESDAHEKRPARSGRLSAIRQILDFVKRLDAIVFTGGGVLDDFWGGPWELPFWLCLWTAAARMRGVKVVFHAVGYDRLDSSTSRTLALNALRWAHYRSFRDAESLQLLRAMGLGGECDVVPDLAFALDWKLTDVAIPPPAAHSYVIVNPVSERMWTHSHDDAYSTYLRAFTALCRALLDRGLSVKLLSTQERMDAGALDHVAANLASEGRMNWERRQVTDLNEFLLLAGRSRLVISSRLHGLILGLVAGTPVVSVSPMRKMTRLMHDVGLSDLCLNLATLRSEPLIAAAERALAQEHNLRGKVTTKVSEYRQRLDESFDRMLATGLLGERARTRFSRDDPHFATRSAQ